MRIDEQIQQTTTDHAQSDDPDYLAWRDSKVRAALAAAKAHPEQRISQIEVWKKFGLEA